MFCTKRLSQKQPGDFLFTVFIGGRVCVPRSKRESASVTVLKMGEKASRSRPAGAGFKPLHAAALKRRGGERWRKGGARHHQVGDEKMIEREPLKTHRNLLRRCQNGGRNPTPGKAWTQPAYGPCGSRCKGGMSSSQASARNEGTWHGMPRETIKWRKPQGEIPMPMTGAEWPVP